MFRFLSSQCRMNSNIRQLSTQITSKVSQNPVIFAAKENIDQSPWKMNFLVKLVRLYLSFFKFSLTGLGS